MFNEHLEYECFTLVNIIDVTIITHSMGVVQDARSYRLIGVSKAPKGVYDIGAILPELGGLQQIQTYLPPANTGGKTYALNIRARMTIMGQEQITPNPRNQHSPIQVSNPPNQHHPRRHKRITSGHLEEPSTRTTQDRARSRQRLCRVPWN